MKLIKQVNLSEVEQILEKHDSNIRFYNYDLPICCRKHEFECFKVELEENDIDRIYLVGNFGRITGNTCKLKDVNGDLALEQEEEERGIRVKRLMDGGDKFSTGIDLQNDEGFEIVLIGRSFDTGSLLIIDGSHRSIAHFLKNGNVNGVPAYVCIHNNITQYSFYKFIAKI